LCCTRFRLWRPARVWATPRCPVVPRLAPSALRLLSPPPAGGRPRRATPTACRRWYAAWLREPSRAIADQERGRGASSPAGGPIQPAPGASPRTARKPAGMPARKQNCLPHVETLAEADSYNLPRDFELGADLCFNSLFCFSLEAEIMGPKIGNRLAASIALLALAFPAIAQTFEDFFNDNVLQEIRIDIKPSDWANLKQHYLEDTYYPADFHWKFQGRDNPVKNIAIRSRGRGSRSPLKPNLRVDFNRIVPGQSLVGLGSCILKANNQDGTQLRERITFNLFRRMGLPASRQAHARLNINDDYQGLYLLTEDIAEEFITRFIGPPEGGGDRYNWKPIDNEPSGYHFEWRPNCAFPAQEACSTDSNRWAPLPFSPHEGNTRFDIRPTIQFIRTATKASDADFPQAIADFTDLKLFMVHNGLEVYMAEFDSILGDVFGANNFWLYRYVGKNLQQFIVWDKDGTFTWTTRTIFQNA